MLPITPTGFADSPYQSPSTFAGNPLLIDLQALVEEGLLDPFEPPGFPKDHIDFGAVIQWKSSVLAEATSRFAASKHLHSDYLGFLESQAWLDEFAVYAALKRSFDSRPWWEWPEEIRSRRAKDISSARSRLEEQIERVRVEQFLFDLQFRRLKEHARERGIGLIGDLPIFVAHDSADVWANPELFKLDPKGMPRVIAGVPPDYFSPTGQRWGNPLYNWDHHKETGFVWWTARIRSITSQFDLVRIDHFRGFEAAWEIPSNEPTAVKGTWVKAPGNELFDSLVATIDPLPLIAEDLGVITPPVVALRKRYGLPGMRVLQFGFGAEEGHTIRNIPKRVIAYTGTHDNDTALGWITSDTPIDEKARSRALSMLQCTVDEFPQRLIEALMNSPAETAIVPLQDHLGLGSEARMNRPGTSEGNWTWRVQQEQLTDETLKRIANITSSCGRWASGTPSLPRARVAST